MSDTTANTGPEAGRRKIWNYAPGVPLSQAPMCEWPLKPLACLTWVIQSWRPLSGRMLFLLVALALWTWFTPALERVQTFAWDWVAEIFLRNLVLVSVTVGGIHVWLYVIRGQGDDERYDTRDLDSKKFHFGSQVRDNMFWTLASSVPVGTAWECLLLWGYANGIAPMITFESNPVWFVGLFLLIPFWSGFHFYWFHRLIHVEPLFTWIHSWHHKNTNTGPWSGHAMHPIEHIGLYSDAVFYFLVASHPVHMQFNLMLHTLGGPTSHCGYHTIRLPLGIRLELGDFMHQLHHRFFDCNYGTYETPWDKVFNSFHDGSPEGDRLIAERRRKLRGGQSRSKKGSTRASGAGAKAG